MFLTAEQRLTLVHDHCARVVNNMNHDDLINYAINKMVESFQTIDGKNISEFQLIQDLYFADGTDTDSMAEFMMGSGIPKETVNLIMYNTVFE